MSDLPEPGSAPSEPLWSVASATAIGAAAVQLAVALGLDLTATQQTAVVALVGALAPLVVAAVGRRLVYSPATVARMLRR